MKTVTVKKKVTDVMGLMRSLKWQRFAVLNVGSPSMDETVVWLDDSEGKDPTSNVMAWADPVQAPAQPLPPAKPKDAPVQEQKFEAQENFLSEAYAAGFEEPKKKGVVGRLFSKIFKGTEKAVDSVAWWQKT